MNISKILVVTVLTSLLMAGSLFAQVQQQAPQNTPAPATSDEVSDTEIDKVVSAISEMEPIQVEIEEKIQAAVEEEGLTFERFQQIMMGMQNPQMANQMDITEEEEQTIQTLQPTLMQIQGEAQQKISEKIEQNGLSMERYQQIVMGAQQDSTLMARVQTKLEEVDES